MARTNPNTGEIPAIVWHLVLAGLIGLAYYHHLPGLVLAPGWVMIAGASLPTQVGGKTGPRLNQYDEQHEQNKKQAYRKMVYRAAWPFTEPKKYVASTNLLVAIGLGLACSVFISQHSWAASLGVIWAISGMSLFLRSTKNPGHTFPLTTVADAIKGAKTWFIIPAASIVATAIGWAGWAYTPSLVAPHLGPAQPWIDLSNPLVWAGWA